MSKKNRDKRISINNKIQSIINKKKNAIKNAETTQPTNIVALPIIRQDNINNHNNEEDITHIASKEYNNTLKNENNESNELNDFIDNSICINKIDDSKITQLTKSLDDLFLKNDSSESDIILDNINNQSKILNNLDSIDSKIIIDLFENINSKINELLQSKSYDYKLLKNCYKYIMLEDYTTVKKLLLSRIDPISKSDLMIHYLSGNGINEIKTIQKMLNDVQQKITVINPIINKIISLSHDLNKENIMLISKIDEIEKTATHKYDLLLLETNRFKNELINIIQFETSTNDNNYDNKSISELFQLLKDHLNRYKNDILNVKRQKNSENSSNIDELNTYILDLKKQIDKLQKDNLKITQNQTKLTEKNIKYQKDLIIFNNEIKKLITSDKIKTETILRQKKLIEMFQEKLINNVYKND